MRHIYCISMEINHAKNLAKTENEHKILLLIYLRLRCDD